MVGERGKSRIFHKTAQSGWVILCVSKMEQLLEKRKKGFDAGEMMRVVGEQCIKVINVSKRIGEGGIINKKNTCIGN